MTKVKELPQSSKMRLRLYDPKDGSLISDRLVEQTTEFTMGPKEVHKGPYSIELNLQDQVTVDSAIEYLKKLKGDLPIDVNPAKKSKPGKTIDAMLSDKEPLLDLIKTIKAKATSQEKLINMLREYDFRFIAADVIQDMAMNDPEIGKQIALRDKDIDKGYQYMVRMVKEAKEPMNDKYDFRLVFAIKIIGDKVDLVPVYLWGAWSETLKLTWEKPKANNFKKVEKVYVFPEFMDYADRKKWRSEHRKFLKATNDGANPELFEVSKSYAKWTPYVKGH